jgi:hypothetical protein
MYQVKDCISDEQITVTQEKRDAERICTDLGGNARGYYVFPVADTVDQAKREVKAENAPKKGELF